MAYDALYDQFTEQAMGVLTEQRNAAGAKLTREEQDAFAARSHQRAAEAWKNGVFDDEVVPVDDPAAQGRPGRRQPGRGRPRRHHGRVAGQAAPGFSKDGTITAGSASQISDGACAVVVMSKAKAEELGLDLARRDRRLRPGRRPRLDPAAAAGQRDREGLPRRRASRSPTSTCSSSTRPSPPSASSRPAQLGVDEDKVNVNGGAIALGHPVGMSGARIVLHLALELKRRGGGIGAAALCGGGGQGDALIIRVPQAEPSPAGDLPSRADRRGSTPLSGVGPRARRAGPRRRRPGGRPADLPGRGRVAAAARGDGRVCAPHAGRRPGRRHHRLAGRRQVHLHQRAWSTELRAAGKRVGVLAVDPSSPFSGGALLGDRVRMQDHALDRDVYIRSMASRGHLGGLAWTTPQALRVLDAAGCDVVLIETVGVGQSEVEIAGLADTTLVLLAPGMGDGIQAAKAGILEIGDVYVVNKADRDGADQVRRDLRSMLALAERREGAWRPPIVTTVAATRRGRRRGGRPRSTGTSPGSGRRASSPSARTRRARDEIEAIAVTALRARWGDVHGRSELDELAAAVVAGKSDPYTAADALLEQQEGASVARTGGQ